MEEGFSLEVKMGLKELKQGERIGWEGLAMEKEKREGGTEAKPAILRL